ncbi:tyrosine-type recombinase/integrase [Sphingosinicella ginsenosidimutans]|uniref:tyrosine-type recombinase/integrase n=1 Tax=Allosphingosinicella ginsenosidimutans TaxID=1176539 RepID=UPI001FB0E475|nr:integrase [Sphingosinicella ginsenosidimutans]
MKALKERVEETAYFGGVDPVTWKKAVVSWAKAWTSLGIKGATGNRYLTSIAQLRPWLDPKSVHEIDAGLLKSIVAARRKLVSNATVRRDLTAISSVLGHCCDEGWIEENPAHMMDRSRFKEKLVKIILPRPDSIARAFAERSRFMDMAELSLETGMRQEEVASLEHDRVDRKRMSISLEHTKSGVREVPLTARAVTIIDRQPQFLRSPYVFWRGDGERFQNVDAQFYATIKRVAQKASRSGASFRRFRFHDLRHLFAVLYLRNRRGTIYDLQMVLGHSSVTTTERYLDHLTPEEKHWATHGVSQNAAQDERFEEGKAG